MSSSTSFVCASYAKHCHNYGYCPNFAHNPLHDSQAFQEIQHAYITFKIYFSALPNPSTSLGPPLSSTFNGIIMLILN